MANGKNLCTTCLFKKEISQKPGRKSQVKREILFLGKGNLGKGKAEVRKPARRTVN